MQNLTAHHLRFTLKVETPIELETQQGSALRGMLYNSLRGPRNNPELGFCTQRHLKTCAECPLVAVCPVASLVATLNPQADRGQDVPRPYAVVPPPGAKTRYEAGEQLTFGLTLFGQALNLFPYVVMALRQAGPLGLGKRLLHHGLHSHPQRGRFVLHAAQALNLLSGEVQDILQPDSTLVQRPDLPVTHAQVVELSQRLLNPEARLSANGANVGSTYLRLGQSGPLDLALRFKSPTRLVSAKSLLKEPHFAPLFHRLFNRLLALSREFGIEARANSLELPPKHELLTLSDEVALIENQTHWQEVWSYSARQQRQTPISGLVGRATYRASAEVWAALLPYVLWGTVIHVGKNAVKGDGIIELEALWPSSRT